MGGGGGFPPGRGGFSPRGGPPGFRGGGMGRGRGRGGIGGAPGTLCEGLNVNCGFDVCLSFFCR